MYFRADVVGGFHDLPEGWFNNDLGLGFMPLKYDVARPESSPHRRHNHDIHVNILHLFPCLFGLLDTLFGDFDIEVVMAKLFCCVLLAVGVLLCAVFGFHLLRAEVELRLCVCDEIYHLILF